MLSAKCKKRVKEQKKTRISGWFDATSSNISRAYSLFLRQSSKHLLMSPTASDREVSQYIIDPDCLNWILLVYFSHYRDVDTEAQKNSHKSTHTAFLS